MCLLCGPAAVTPMQSLAWELPYAMGAALKKKKKLVSPGCKNSNTNRYKIREVKVPRDNICVLGNTWGEKPGKRYLYYGFVYCMRVALRCISRNRIDGVRNYFHFVKKQDENKEKERLAHSMEKKNGSTDGTLSWMS